MRERCSESEPSPRQRLDDARQRHRVDIRADDDRFADATTISIRPTGPDAATATAGAVSAVTVTGTSRMGSRLSTAPAVPGCRR
jgi:hypothetical protein